MANEFRHASVGTELSQSEWEAVGTHIFNSQATGDILYASSATQLSRLGIGSTNQILTISGGVPAWTATPTLTSATITTATITNLTTDTFDSGTSGSPESYTAGSPVFELYATSSNATSTNAEPFYLKSVMTGAGGYGGRSRFHAYTNVALGSNFMALKAHTEYGSAGSCAGLSTALCCELGMPNADITSAGGAYYALELEYVSGGTSLVTNGSGTQAGFIYMNQSGDDNGDFDDNGYFIRVDGLTAGAGHILSADSQTLKVNLEGTTRYLVMSQAENALQMGVDANPAGDTTLYGTTSGTYLLWDVSNESLDIYSKMAVATGTTAEDAVKINITDASTISGNMNRGLFVNYTSSGAKTGSAQVNCIAYDLSVTANCPDVYLEAGYLATVADKTIGNLFGISLYFEDFGNAVTNFCMLDLGYNSPHAPASRNCFIRCRQHNTVQSGSVVLQLEGNSAAESFLAADTATNLIEAGDVTSGKSCTYGVRCKVGSTVFVLAGYED